MRVAIMAFGGFVLGILMSSPSVAEDGSICADAQTTIEIGACVSKAYKEADAELNAVWKKVMATFKTVDYMDPKDLEAWKETLLASQRAWITFKEKDCEAVGYEWFGGTGRSNAIVFCELDHTEARTKNLKTRFLDR